MAAAWHQNRPLPRGRALLPAVRHSTLKGSLGHGLGTGSRGSTIEQFMILVQHKAGCNYCRVYRWCKVRHQVVPAL